ncbi:MAG TPA: PilZ domain-containing protein [Blastocatellia bacterium]|nr:PilZ domain-containing protein [Blastocatellia bacterium]
MSSIPPPGQPAAPAGGAMSAWFLELERLLDRLERAGTHYQVLGVNQASGREEVLTAYRQTLGFLFPVAELFAVLPPDTQRRMDQALEKATQAFTVLAIASRRRDYDRTLTTSREPSIPVERPKPAPPIIPPARPPEKVQITPPVTPKPQSPAELLEVKRPTAQREVYSEYGRRDDNNRRRCDRFKMSLPVRVTGHDRHEGKWHEVAESVDVSRTGVRLHLRRRVMHNTILYLTLPLPLKLRAHGFTETTYNVYGIVRRILPQPDGRRLVGLEFIGEHPPAGWLDKPWAICRTKQWAGINRRRHPRFDRAEPVVIEFLTEDKKFVAREEGITENISRGGMRVKLKTAPSEFDLVRISASKFSFESLAVMTNRYTGPDGSPRISLQLIEREWPVDRP